MASPIISKSKFLSAIQCPLLLWTQYNDKSVIPEPDAQTRFIFETGHRVGDLSKALYPTGVEVPFDPAARDLKATVETTNALLARRIPIFEASFLVEGPTGGRYVRADILVPAADGAWDLIEVKSSTNIKSINIWDVAYQCDTLERAGVKLNRLCLMHVDTGYVRQGAVDPAGLFHCADITDQARERAPRVPGMFDRAAQVIAGSRPDTPLGPHCRDPYDCAMKEVCWGGLPDHPVTELTRAGKKAFRWMDQGYLRIADVPDTLLTANQIVQKEAIAAGRMHVDANAVARLKAQLEYPLWHLDFESINPAVPLFDGTRPYQQIPFQFSLHVQNTPGDAPRHVEYLCTVSVDPRPGLLEALTAIGPQGSVLAFNAGFEARVLKDLGTAFSDRRAMTDDLTTRLHDLANPFRKWQIYHPEQHGRYSLKAVLPALTGLHYDDLDIADGQTAGREFLRVVFGVGVEAEEKQTVLERLKAYCGRDTLAMVEILGAL